MCRRFVPTVSGLEHRISLSGLAELPADVAPADDCGCGDQDPEPAPEPDDYPGDVPPFVPLPPTPIGPAGPAF